MADRAGGRRLSPSRIRNAAQVLGQVLDAAVAGGRLHRNPAQGLRRPRIVEREMTFLTVAELERLASQIENPYGGAGALPRLDGLTDREAAALRVGRLDLLARRVEVAEAATEVNGRLAWAPTETGSAAPCHSSTSWPTSSAPTWPTGPTPRRSGIHHAGRRAATGLQVGERYFRPAVSSAGLPQSLRVHDLRHTAASLAIRENASVKIVQAMLGHRSATQTLDRYGHLYPSALDALADRLDRAHAAAMATEV